MTERLVLTSTYHPPVGEDTRQVCFDATKGSYKNFLSLSYSYYDPTFHVKVTLNGEPVKEIIIHRLSPENIPEGWDPFWLK